MPLSPHRLLTELRRRKVFRVAGAYLVAAFVVLQVGDIVVEPLDLPAWTMTLLIVAAGLGLPVALALAWAFDLTADGIRRTADAPADGPVPAAVPSPRAAGYVGLGILVGLIGFGGYAYLGQDAGGDPRTINSVAVLPFVNMSGDPENEYFSDGITEELLDVLANVEGLRVPARTSSFQFKGETIDVREVGRRLDVQAVLEGSVRKAGTEVRITAQLIDAASGYHIWSSSYERELSDVFAVQDEIARAIVDALRLKLAGGGTPEPAAVPVTSAEAHDHYLLGRYHFHRRGAESLREAVRHFDAAIEADPSYAAAHAGLALTWAVLPLFDPDGAPVERAIVEGKAAAQRALALDAGQAEAHAALAQIAQNFERDLDTAERHYERAVQLAPNNPVVRQWRTEVLVIRGRPEAPQAMEAAVALDPLSPIANSVAAFAHLLVSRDFERSAYFWNRVDELDPTFVLLTEYAPLTFVALGDGERAAGLLLRMAPTAADSQAFRAWAAASAALRRGDPIDAAARAAALDGARRYGALASDADVGRAVLTGTIDADAALDLLVEVVDEPRYRQPLTWVGQFWFFDPLREDARFQRLMRAVGLGS